MQLAAVAETSERVRQTSKRLEKIDLLAQLLRQLHPDETEIVVAFLAGEVRQGRIGIGGAALRDAMGSPAQNPSLEIADVDRTLDQIATTCGSGSQRQRMELLRRMFERATVAE